MEEENAIHAAHKFLKAQQEGLRVASAHKGQPRVAPYSRSQLLASFSAAAATVEAREKKLQPLFVSETYPPCATALKDLRRITLGQLRLETRHRGCALILRIFGHPLKLAEVLNAVEDETGEVDRISLYNFSDTLSAARVLPKNAIIGLKEPYYRSRTDGKCTLRVDHPSDLVVLEDTDVIVPSVWRAKLPVPAKSSIVWKTEGNDALKREDHVGSFRCYTLGLESISTGDVSVERDIYRNRALVGLALGRYDTARADALASISGDKDDESIKKDTKGLYRAARAAYRLGDFKGAHSFLRRLLKLSPNDNDGLRELQRTETRLEEENKAAYDLTAIAKAMPAAKYHADHANFISKTCIRQTARHGRGLFATQFIKAGDIVLCEKAFVSAHNVDGKESITMLKVNDERSKIGNNDGVWARVVQKLIHNPSLAKEVVRLHAGPYTVQTGDSTAMVDGSPVVDVFLIRAIIEHNCFGFSAKCRPSSPYGSTGNTDVTSSSTGIWIQASYMNHSCVCNAEHSFIGDMIVVRAVTDIPKGAEITTSYISTLEEPDVSRRQKITRASWSFECSCALCAAEWKVSAAVRETRASHLASSKLFIEENSAMQGSKPGKHLVARADALVSDLQATYPAHLFQDLPRLAIVDLRRWLWIVQYREGNRDEAIAQATALLRDMGYEIHFTGAYNVQLRSRHGKLSSMLVETLLFIAYSNLAEGYEIIGRKIVDLARRAYVTINGEPSGFEACCPRPGEGAQGTSMA